MLELSALASTSQASQAQSLAKPGPLAVGPAARLAAWAWACQAQWAWAWALLQVTCSKLQAAPRLVAGPARRLAGPA